MSGMRGLLYMDGKSTFVSDPGVLERFTYVKVNREDVTHRPIQEVGNESEDKRWAFLDDYYTDEDGNREMERVD